MFSPAQVMAPEAIGCWPLSLWLPYPIYRSTHLAHHRDENLTDPLDDPESYYWADGQWRDLGPLGRAVVAAQSTLLGRIIDSYHVAPGKGVPIGSLTSQHFANFYLG